MALMAEWHTALSNLHFERPAWLLAVPLLLALAAWLARRSAAGGHWARWVDAPLLEALRLPEPPLSRASPWPWLALAWVLAVLALAGPTWQREPAAAHSSPDGWVLVLDLSPSMLTPDVAPNRVTRARYAIEDVLRTAQGARVGLIVFSAEPYTVTPLTDDAATVRGLTGPLAPELMPTAGDNAGPGLVMAQQLLERTLTRGGRVVLLTDGYADAPAATAAAQSLRERGSQVDVLAIGGLVDRAPLQALARAGGGRVFGLAEMPALRVQLKTRVARSATAVAEVEAVRWRDAGVWLLPPLLLLAALLARRGWW